MVEGSSPFAGAFLNVLGLSTYKTYGVNFVTQEMWMIVS